MKGFNFRCDQKL